MTRVPREKGASSRVGQGSAGFVLHTNVVSALRVRGRHRAVEAWAAQVPVSDQYISAMTVAELERGVIAKERIDPAQGEVLRRWFEDRVLPAFGDRILSFDLSAARVLAGYRVPEHAPLDDALVAAVGQSAGMTVVTRNVKYFRPLGVPCIDPWKSGAGSRPARDE